MEVSCLGYVTVEVFVLTPRTDHVVLWSLEPLLWRGDTTAWFEDLHEHLLCLHVNGCRYNHREQCGHADARVRSEPDAHYASLNVDVDSN